MSSVPETFPRLKSPVKLEEDVLSFWARERIFERSLEQGQGKPRWVFYEGPPTANGTPHNGHVLTRVMKDVFPRYRTMRGYHVDRKAGWDTHGLPVETEVEKTLGIHGKAAIEAYGLEAFSRKCVDSVFTYVKEWEDLTRNIGFWVDLDQAYVTYHRPYVESVWWALASLYERGLLYQGHKVVWWWPQGGTTLSAGEVGMGYKEVDDPAVTVRFRSIDEEGVSFLAWTTTPWTLPSNVGLAVGANVDYAYVEDPHEPGKTVVAAVALLESLGITATPSKVVKGSELVGKRYAPLFDFGPPQGGDGFRVVAGDHVTTSDGSGIVHTAPAFGEDDMAVAKKNGLGILQWVEPDGKFAANTGYLAGKFCKDADKEIITDLKERGFLFKKDTVRHPYPFCWRADSDPLIQYARPAWFIKTTDFVKDALDNNNEVRWLPDHIKEGRFGDFLRNNVDWALSRERFWGTPLPIWVCPACEARRAFESVAALEAAGAKGFVEGVDRDLQVHKPWIDNVTVPCACGATMKRVPEVIDCWFDSGCMPFAQWGFPHQGREEFKASYPADFISEAIDQTRGWFYSLMMSSTILFNEETCQKYDLDPVSWPRPYKTCIVLGHVCDMDGRKESKSKGNYTSPNLVMRGRTQLMVKPDGDVKPGTVGLLKDQVRSLELGREEHVSVYVAEGGPVVKGEVVAAKVKGKDTIHLHPSDIATLGLAAEGGTAWFHLPIDPPGADAFRWLFCASSAPWANTRLSLRAIRDGQREFLIRLRNVVQFFQIYADIAVESGQIDFKAGAPRGASVRHKLDRWILHRLDATVREVTTRMDNYQLYEASQSVLAFVDALSNWYLRRSRTRFWGEGRDAIDALWTLHEVLVTTARLIAPFVPFTAESMWQSLVVAPGLGGASSVHLAAWPEARQELVFDELDRDMALVRDLASLGLAARAATKVKVRQPLAAVTLVLADPRQRHAVEGLKELLTDELNVREIVFANNAGEFVEFTVKPNFKTLGQKLGKEMKKVQQWIGEQGAPALKAALDAGGIDAPVEAGTVRLTAEDVLVTITAKGDLQAASSGAGVVVLSPHLDDDLRAEGFVRELVNRVQNLRKERQLGYTQRVVLNIDGNAAVRAAVEAHGAYLANECLVRDGISLGLGDAPVDVVVWDVDGHEVRGTMRTV